MVKIRLLEDRELDAVWPGLVADHLEPQRGDAWYGAFDGNDLVGVAHLVTLGGSHLFDDLWVVPARRRTGVGHALVAHVQGLRDDLWLICDPPEEAYYRRFGFRRSHALPRPIIDRYTRLGQWPGHLDHVHVAMHWSRADPHR